MPLVEQAIEGAATPSHLDDEGGLERTSDRPQSRDPDLRDLARLDRRDERATHAGGASEVLLSPPSPATKGPDRGTELGIAHALIVTPRPSPARIGQDSMEERRVGVAAQDVDERGGPEPEGGAAAGAVEGQ